MVRLSPARIAAYAAAALLPLGVFAAIPAASASPAGPPLRLVAASKEVTVYNSTEDAHVALELGTHMIAGSQPFEIRVTRASYHDPIIARQVVSQKPFRLGKALPKKLVSDWTGFAKFFHVTIKNAAGKKVAELDQSFCPGSYETARTRPDAVPTSRYPWGCGDNPFTRGSVWGIEAGWSSSTFSWNRYGMADGPELPAGDYTATIKVNKPFLTAFAIPAAQSSATVKMKVKTMGWSKPDVRRSAASKAARMLSAGTPAKPNAKRPTGKASAPNGPRPDLQALPAFGIRISDPEDDHDHGDPQPAPEGDYLSFGANVWNAGTSPLVVDGFRKPGEDLMTAYQYFYDAKGKQVGWVQTGDMEYDTRDGHQHWHFRDFARYRLLSADKQTVVTSQKEAFCLAATDAVDLTLEGSAWRPNNRDLGSACGSQTALAIREYLDTGWGDTYTQDRPGQSFDISAVPNGTYYIEVVANPEKRLNELNLMNNTSYRQVILGGTKGARTVTVPPYELIDAP